MHDDVRLDVEEQVVVATAHLQQQGRLLHQRLFEVRGRQEGHAVQLHDDVTVSDAAPEIGRKSSSSAFHFKESRYLILQSLSDRGVYSDLQHGEILCFRNREVCKSTLVDHNENIEDM